MRIRTTLVLLSLLIALRLEAGIPPRVVSGERWAVIAISPERESAAARRLPDVLVSRYGYDPSRVVLLAGRAATAEAIKESIAHLTKLERAPESVLIVIDAPLSALHSGGIVVAGSEPSQPWTLLQSFELARLVQQIPIPTVLTIAPACEESGLQYVDQGGYFVRTLLNYCLRVLDPPINMASVSATLANVLDELGSKGVVSTAQDLLSAMKVNPVLYARLASYATSDEFRFRPTSSVVSPHLVAIRNTAASPEARSEAIEKVVNAVLTEPKSSRSGLEQFEAAALAFVAIARDAAQPPPLREKAVWAIGQINYLPAVSDFDMIYQASAPELRKAILRAGAALKPPAVEKLIRRGVADVDPSIRTTALRLLTELKDLSGADAAAALLSDPNPEVVVAAIQSLALLRPQFTDVEKPTLIALLKHPAPAVRKEAVGVVVSLAETNALRDAFANERDDAVRAAIAYGLGRVPIQAADRKAASAALRNVATSTELSSVVREAAVWALGEQSLSDAERALIDILRSRNDAPNVRQAAAEALGKLGSQSANQALIRALQPTETAEVRVAAATALGKIGSPAATEALAMTLKDADPYVRAAAEEALKALDTTADSVTRLLNSPEPLLRADGARKLAAMNTPAAGARLLDLFTDPDPTVRDAALEGLSGMSSMVPRTDVEQRLAAAEPHVRYAAAVLLGRWRQPESAPALISRANDPHPPVRAAVLDALQHIGSPATEAIFVAAARDRDAGVRLVAAKGLAKASSPEAAVALRQLSEDPAPEVRQIAIDSLRMRSKMR